MLGGRFVHRWHDRLVNRMSLVSAACMIALLGIAVAVALVEIVRPIPSQAAIPTPLFDARTFDNSTHVLSTGDAELRPHPTLPAVAPPKVKQKTKPVKRDRSSQDSALFGPPGDSGPLGIPVLVLQAYQNAERLLTANEPACHMNWWTLAGIGHTESGHAQSGRVEPDGTTRGRILGPRLDGHIPGDTVIKDTDKGVLDGDTVYDRAVGPMQFIPGTWRLWGVDANGDGKADPNNVFDATATAAYYLCNGGRDIAKPDQLKAAILSYNNSEPYFLTVTEWAKAYHDRAVAIANSELAVASEPSAAPTPADKTSTKARPRTTTAARSASPTSASSGATAAPSTSSGSSGSSGATSGSPSPTQSASSGGGLGGLLGGFGGGSGSSSSSSTSTSPTATSSASPAAASS